MRLDAERLRASALIVGVAGVNAFLGLVFVLRGVSLSALLSFVPLIIVVFGLLVVSNRTVLLVGALGLSMTFSTLQKPLPLPGGKLYGADLIVMIGFATWFARRLTTPAHLRTRLSLSPLFGLQFIFFACVTLWAALRGHYSYGANLVGEPVRLFAYGLLVFALVDLRSRETYRTIVAVFYVGSVWMFFNAIYYLASGTSQTDQIDLSTGGKRVLSLGTAIYLAGGLFLALLNLEIDRLARRRAVHLLVAVLSFAGIVVAYGRATYLAVAVVVPALFVFLPKVRRAFFSMLPICVPFLLIFAIVLPHVAPSVVPTFTNRVLKSNGSDSNVLWRKSAAEALWQQVHESPITGVGFGRNATFRFNGIPVTINQDPHDSFLYLLAGGGVLTLVGFLLLMGTYAVDAAKRLRRTTDPHQRLIILWSSATLCAFLINAAAGPVLSDPRMLLTIWAVLLLPSTVRPAGEQRATPARVPAPVPRVA